jgi:hypothetical protein
MRSRKASSPSCRIYERPSLADFLRSNRSIGVRVKLSQDPSATTPRIRTPESLALARWYDSRPAVRRLWCIKEAQKLRVIVALEPTLDGDDVSPTWFANREAWASELHLCTGRPVQLELVHGAIDRIEIGAESVLIDDLFWRDATLVEHQTVL